MTIDKEKLKALAEAQEYQDWSIFFAGRAMRSNQRMFSLNGPSAVSCHENWGFTLEAAQYIAAASPATVLALLAEIEKLSLLLEIAERDRDHYEKRTRTLVDVKTYSPQIINSEDGWGREIRFAGMVESSRSGPDGLWVRYQDFRQVAAERDQFKAENEALRKLKLPHYLKLSDEMRAAGDHAEQRAREDQCYSVPALKAVFFEAAIQRWLDDQEEAIDAAMAKEASHG